MRCSVRCSVRCAICSVRSCENTNQVYPLVKLLTPVVVHTNCVATSAACTTLGWLMSTWSTNTVLENTLSPNLKLEVKSQKLGPMI